MAFPYEQFEPVSNGGQKVTVGELACFNGNHSYVVCGYDNTHAYLVGVGASVKGDQLQVPKADISPTHYDLAVVL